MARIFISYERSSKELVERLVSDLDRYDIWYDQQLEGGSKWWDDIVAAIRNCDVLLAGVTPQYLNSTPCKRELAYASALGRLVVPVWLSDDVSPDRLSPPLRDLQWVDYRRGDVRAFKTLTKRLDDVRAPIALPDRLPPPPPPPISQLSLLREQIEAEEQLTRDQQFQIVVNLGVQFRDGAAGDVIGELVGRLRRRDDLYAKVGPEIEQLMREIDGSEAPQIIQRRANPDDIEKKKDFASAQGPLPGHQAEPFTPLRPSVADELLVRPSAYPLTPMYLLDDAFRILDWNQAFSVAFDRTMEGRKGESVVEWTYFLDNYEEIIAHGLETFGNANALPPIDVEDIAYTSMRYGQFSATKRAYQIPDDTGVCIGWLVTLELHFPEDETVMAFRRDLLGVLGRDLMWSEYAVSYDRVLNNTKVYPALLDRFIAGMDGTNAIPADARIIDLGAGTGNLTQKLITASPRRLVFAAENNRMMLELLKEKCKKYMRSTPDKGGVFAVKQDITSLYGLEDGFFDYALMNNVLYSVDDVDACLQEVWRVLKPGGELRLSGPREDTKLDILFDEIQNDLKASGKFDQYESDFYHVKRLNELRLSEMLYRWTTAEVEGMLRKAGFSDVKSTEDIYCGQSMFVCARK